MKKYIGVLLFIWAGGWFVSCGTTNDAPQVVAAQVGPNKACESESGPAVSVNLLINNEPLADRVKIMYRLNGGEWIVYEEFASGSTTIPGPAGKYEIKAQKDGYVLESATVIVPNDQDCSVIKQVVNFSFSRAACLEVIPITVQVLGSTPQERLTVSVRFPGDDPQERPCDSGFCSFNLSPSNSGVYEVIYSGFSNDTDPVMDGGFIRKLYTPVEVLISVENRRHHIVSQAVDTLNIGIPYGLAASGCYEVDFYGITVDSTPMSATVSGAISEEANLQINSLSSPVCSQSTTEIRRVRFSVDVPAGTPIADIKVEYWKDRSWQAAQCEFHEGYVCVAEYNNPLIADKYHVRTIIRNQEYLGAFIPLEGKCISFE
jgi:hypothetical protein